MIGVSFDPDLLEGDDKDWWDDWRRRTREATEQLIERVSRGEPPSFDKELWAELKRWLLRNVFHGKCAYCESKVLSTSWGDAEHWRPKGALTVHDGDANVPVERDSQSHPGYWWLAYEWSNVLPACERCNRGEGKDTQFPVAATHAFGPDEVAVDALNDFEEPLLLHPYHGHGPDPTEHLSYNDFGQVSPTGGSEFGQCSIAVFALDRSDLESDRLEILQKADHGFKAAWAAIGNGTSTWDDEVERWQAPNRLYSLAAHQFFERRLETASAGLPRREAPPE